MANAIVVKSRVMAQDVNALNRTGKINAEVKNGQVFTCGECVGSVYALTKATNAVKDVWMAHSPEVVLTGGMFLGLDKDPRNFSIQANKPVDIFKLAVGDTITVTADFFKAVGNIPDGSKKVVELDASGDFVALASATGSYAGLSLKVVEETYVVIATGAIGADRVKAWKLEVTQN